MKIRDVEFYVVQIDRGGGNEPVRSLLVCLSSDCGEEGWGEASLPWRLTELAPRRDTLLPSLEGRSVFDVEELGALDAVDGPALASALDMASWDLVGRIVGQPVCHLWGGSYRQRVPAVVRLPDPPADAVRMARELADQGFHRQVVSATGNVDIDVETVAAVMEAAPDRVEVRVAGNGTFELEEARRFCLALEEVGVECLIDPLREGGLAALASLVRHSSVPIASRRAIDGPRSVMAAARSGAAGGVVVDPNCVGGLSSARKCAVVAEAAGMTASLSSPPSMGVAVAALAQLAAATTCLAGGNECDYHQLKDDVLIEPIEIVDGMIALPPGPGLGIQVDRAKLEMYQPG
jgi:L-alanine-DL-glutamate epimerase-like enolase superfamily enzyme